VRTQKENEQVGVGHSLPEERRGKLGRGKKASEKGALTNWRMQIKGHVRT
jgi:hypothetical protein